MAVLKALIVFVPLPPTDPSESLHFDYIGRAFAFGEILRVSICVPLGNRRDYDGLVRFRWCLALTFALPMILACGGGSDEGNAGGTETPAATSAPVAPTLPPFPTRAPQATSTPVNTYAPDVRTEIDVVDGALDAMQAADGAALLDQLSFHPYRCDNAPAGTVGSNPCPPGVPDGSAVDVIAAGGCEVMFLARERANLAGELQAFADAASRQGVYAVVEVQTGRLVSPLPLRYLVILSDGYSLLLDDTGITHLGMPCEGVGPAQLYHPADRPILPPL